MEIWELYDRNRQKTGRTICRGEEIPAGYFHLLIHVCLFNSEGKLLIQRRHPLKKGWPCLWDVTAAGSVVAGEDTVLAAQRELAEEVGIAMDFTGILPRLTNVFHDGFDDVFIVWGDVNPEELTLQEEEVSEVRFASLEEVMELHRQGKFIPYPSMFLPLLFQYGQEKRTL